MIRRHATAEDFQRWEDAARAMTTDCLLYSAKDCRKVEALWRGVDGMVEGFYSDQASTYAMELRRRQMGGSPHPCYNYQATKQPNHDPLRCDLPFCPLGE